MSIYLDLISLETMPEPTLRNALRRLRERLDVTQEQLARLMGTTTRTVASWESGSVESLPADVLLHLNLLATDAGAEELSDFFAEQLLAGYANRDARELGMLVYSFLPLNLKEMRLVIELLRRIREKDPAIKDIVEELQLLEDQRRLQQKAQLKTQKPSSLADLMTRQTVSLRDLMQGPTRSIPNLPTHPETQPEERKSKARRKK